MPPRRRPAALGQAARRISQRPIAAVTAELRHGTAAQTRPFAGHHHRTHRHYVTAAFLLVSFAPFTASRRADMVEPEAHDVARQARPPHAACIARDAFSHDGRRRAFSICRFLHRFTHQSGDLMPLVSFYCAALGIALALAAILPHAGGQRALSRLSCPCRRHTAGHCFYRRIPALPSYSTAQYGGRRAGRIFVDCSLDDALMATAIRHARVNRHAFSARFSPVLFRQSRAAIKSTTLRACAFAALVSRHALPFAIIYAIITSKPPPKRPATPPPQIPLPPSPPARVLLFRLATAPAHEMPQR